MAETSPQTLEVELSLSAYARSFRMARETVSKRLFLSGVKPSGKRKGHDVYSLGPAATAIVLAEYGGFDGAVKDPETLPPKDRKDFYTGSNEKLKLERESGLLIEKSMHDAVVFALGGVLVSALESIPDLLERRCNLDPDQLDSVEDAINQARERLAEQLEEYTYDVR